MQRKLYVILMLMTALSALAACAHGPSADQAAVTVQVKVLK